MHNSDVNELYSLEHWMMIQADLLEQSYCIHMILIMIAMFTVLYELGKYKRTVKPKALRQLSSTHMDPNKFPINPITTTIGKYESIWEADERKLMEEIEEKTGHQLIYKKSAIDHPGTLQTYIV